MPKKHLSPHDRFVRLMMTDPKVIREFFEENLPADIKAIADLNTLIPQKESFVDDHLRLQITDLLYSVEFEGEEGFFYILCEHASSQDLLLPFRMLKYSIAVMDHHLKKSKSKKLPLLYPLIFYTGSRPYKLTTDLFDLFGSYKERARNIFSHLFHLIDLSQVTDEHLKAHLWYGVMARLMKHIYEKSIIPALQDLMADLQKIEKSEEMRYIYGILSYAMEAGEVSNKEEFIRTVTQGLKTVDEDTIMTIAEQLKQEVFNRGIQQGMQQGIQQGMQEGRFGEKLEIARSMLLKGIDTKTIMEVTHLSFDQIKEILN